MDASERVGVAGDWHGNTAWAVSVIQQLSEQLGEPKLILHTGDFGIWPGEAGQQYQDEVVAALKRHGCLLRFVDGNHEDFTQLERWRLPASSALVARPALAWLPRGTRWEWYGRRWLALGGAVSVDKSIRREGVSWWPEESITFRQADEVAAAGPVEVMVCHDAPMGVPISFMRPPSFWADADLARAQRHRELLADVVMKVRPAWLIHGHYHQGAPGWRDAKVQGHHLKAASLDMDGRPGNWGILNVKTMEWET